MLLEQSYEGESGQLDYDGKHACDDYLLLQVPADDLRDRQNWASGWLQKVELEGLLAPGPDCKACKGSEIVQLSACSARNQGS